MMKKRKYCSKKLRKLIYHQTKQLLYGWFSYKRWRYCFLRFRILSMQMDEAQDQSIWHEACLIKKHIYWWKFWSFYQYCPFLQEHKKWRHHPLFWWSFHFLMRFHKYWYYWYQTVAYFQGSDYDHIKNDNDRDHDGCHSKSIRSTFRIIALK